MTLATDIALIGHGEFHKTWVFPVSPLYHVAATSNQPVGHGIVRGESYSDARTDECDRHAELSLEIDGNMFADEVIFNLLDDWIVPVIVGRLIQDSVDSVFSAVLD